MEEYIDLHSHILPGLDDGSKNMDQTLKMLEIAYSEGIRTIIATPHYQDGILDNNLMKVEASISELKEHITDKFPDLKLLVGSEIYFSHDVISLLSDNLIPTLSGSRYILVEFSPMAESRYMEDGLQRLILEGYLPILAHAERYDAIRTQIGLIAEWISMGIYIQVNAMSIEGAFGKNHEKLSKKLLKKHWVHFVATDCHSDRTRAPRIRDVACFIAKKYGEEYKNEIFFNNPMKVIDNNIILH